MERTDQPDQQPTPTRPQPNQVMAEPATPDTCAGDLRTPTEQQIAAGAAREQAAFTRINAAGG